jgi:hypothetical protein
VAGIVTAAIAAEAAEGIAAGNWVTHFENLMHETRESVDAGSLFDLWCCYFPCWLQKGPHFPRIVHNWQKPHILPNVNMIRLLLSVTWH